jgi:hypothetical protein
MKRQVKQDEITNTIDNLNRVLNSAGYRLKSVDPGHYAIEKVSDSKGLQELSEEQIKKVNSTFKRFVASHRKHGKLSSISFPNEFLRNDLPAFCKYIETQIYRLRGILGVY